MSTTHSPPTELITGKLLEFCASNDATCLYAVESGSRAWGFASPDSDYDVRFLYIRPAAVYSRLTRSRDVLEYMDDTREFDFVGWDVAKALTLLGKSNPSIIEWLSTPASSIYHKDEAAYQILQTTTEQCFSAKTLALHYISLGNDHIRKYFLGKTEIMPKRYFYTLRSILSTSYVLEHGKPAPIVFTDLLTESDLDDNLRDEIDKLLHIKMHSKEKQTISMVTQLDNYITSKLSQLATATKDLPDTHSNDNQQVAEDAFAKLLKL